MGLYTKLPVEVNQVDVIIAGGGTAACVVASRLADADPELSILVIESGPNNEIPTIQHPGLFMLHLSPESKVNQFYLTKESPEIADRKLVLATGSVLGGGSSTNMMMYSRAQRSDWDSWGTPGWSADEMLPFLKKLETYHGKDGKGVHGHDGPIHVSRGTYNSQRIEDEAIAAAEKLGWSEVDGASDFGTANALCRAKRFISTDGKRQDAASCYLHPRLRDGKHPNLHVLVESQVTRILLDEDHKAVGVEFRPNPLFHPDADQSTRSVKANKLFIASCGACGTPSLLERSGIGAPNILKGAGVSVAVDLPGVGKGYEDHHLLGYPYLNNLSDSETLDGLVLGRMGSYDDLMKKNEKMLGWNGQEIQGKIRPTDAEVAALGPDFQKAWDQEFKNQPDKPLAIINIVAGFPGDLRQATGDPCLAVTAFTVYPFSRGHIHITGPSVSDPVDFDTGFFQDEGQLDIKKHIWFYKKQRELIRRMPSYRGEMAKFHPPFAADSAAACVKLSENPLSGDVADITYSAEDDIVLEKFLRENVSTTWHSLGTCKMLPREQDGVVDRNLSVYGVKGLKIADLSIAPRNVAANTNDTALAVGERAADIFIRELGLGSA
ncbi:putative alcohol oxidase [Annulohypoxylon maeteangense]|uniref:putative alcohol oxidase n=1 Tax=Annulohypoxylon maeteangense TaxID=1927788 RepID=UPI002008AFAC|nr:putative alcohol oxidase [Annulohypoxylon maeteangense]KAI0886205.1 putative alcohol oxidase [Annulohypoxylon maeteangense]